LEDDREWYMNVKRVVVAYLGALISCSSGDNEGAMNMSVEAGDNSDQMPFEYIGRVIAT
jgi:hypothetical protein